jgi:hypothetical protein
MIKKKNIPSDEVITSTIIDFQRIKKERHIEVQLPNTKISILNPK